MPEVTASGLEGKLEERRKKLEQVVKTMNDITSQQNQLQQQKESLAQEALRLDGEVRVLLEIVGPKDPLAPSGK